MIRWAAILNVTIREVLIQVFLKALMAAATKSLVDEKIYKLESEQMFSRVGTTLGNLSDLLRIIWKELTQYTVVSASAFLRYDLQLSQTFHLAKLLDVLLFCPGASWRDWCWCLCSGRVAA